MAEKTSIPKELAILPVRDMVLFPGGVLPLTVGRESSLALLNALEGPEKLLGVIAQLDPRVEEPADVDLHRVGTVAKRSQDRQAAQCQQCGRIRRRHRAHPPRECGVHRSPFCARTCLRSKTSSARAIPS